MGNLFWLVLYDSISFCIFTDFPPVDSPIDSLVGIVIGLELIVNSFFSNSV